MTSLQDDAARRLRKYADDPHSLRATVRTDDLRALLAQAEQVDALKRVVEAAGPASEVWAEWLAGVVELNPQDNPLQVETSRLCAALAALDATEG